MCLLEALINPPDFRHKLINPTVGQAACETKAPDALQRLDCCECRGAVTAGDRCDDPRRRASAERRKLAQLTLPDDRRHRREKVTSWITPDSSSLASSPPACIAGSIWKITNVSPVVPSKSPG
jgi:hypothetical protein